MSMRFGSRDTCTSPLLASLLLFARFSRPRVPAKSTGDRNSSRKVLSGKYMYVQYHTSADAGVSRRHRRRRPQGRHPARRKKQDNSRSIRGRAAASRSARAEAGGFTSPPSSPRSSGPSCNERAHTRERAQSVHQRRLFSLATQSPKAAARLQNPTKAAGGCR